MQYLAEFEIPTGDVCLGAVVFPAAPRSRSWYPDRWFERLRRIGRAHLALPGTHCSVRSSLREGRCEQVVMFRAPAKAAPALRSFLASFLELMGLAEESVSLPMNREEHDRATEAWPQYLARVGMGDQGGEPWLAANFRVQPFLGELLDEASAHGFDFFHQINVERVRWTPEVERQARRHHVQLETLRGIPRDLLELERQLLNRPGGDVLLVEELVGTNSTGGAGWLQNALRSRFESQFRSTGLAAPATVFEDQRFRAFTRQQLLAEVAAAGLHSAALRAPGVREMASQAERVEDAEVLLDWSGPMRRWFEPALAPQKNTVRATYEEREQAEQREATTAAAAAASQQPPLRISTEVGRYDFVSYRRKDFPTIAPLLVGLDAAQHAFWFDRGIPGASNWLGILQDRVRECRAVILFLSRAAAESRYVQMEVRYALALSKPILPVCLEPLKMVDLPGGLGLLLSSIQSVSVDLAAILAHLRRLER
jgi:hypothetical protein